MVENTGGKSRFKPHRNVWHQLKHHLRRHVKPQIKDELMAGIGEFWQTTPTIDICDMYMYINHLHKVIPAVIEREECASGYMY